MDTNESLKPVFYPSNDSEKLIILSLFEENDVSYNVENQNNQDLFGIGRFGGYNFVTGPQRILVNESQFTLAKTIIENYKYDQLPEAVIEEDDLTELKKFNLNLNAAVVIGFVLPGLNFFHLYKAIKTKIFSAQKLKGLFRLTIASIFFLFGFFFLVFIIMKH